MKPGYGLRIAAARDRLREHLQVPEIDQKAFSDLLRRVLPRGASRASVSGWYAERIRPSREVTEAISILCGVRRAWLEDAELPMVAEGQVPKVDRIQSRRAPPMLDAQESLRPITGKRGAAKKRGAR